MGDRRPTVATRTTSLETGRHREWSGGLHHEHDELVQMGRAGTEVLHRHVGIMPVHGLEAMPISAGKNRRNFGIHSAFSRYAAPLYRASSRGVRVASRAHTGDDE
jgi:hypothetical protein